MPTSADAIANSRVSGKPVNGRPPPCFGGLFGGGLSKVTPSTDGETVGDTEALVAPTPVGGLVVPPPVGGVVVPPPVGGGLVVPPPGGGLAGLPLAGQVLLIGDVVGNAVVLSGEAATPLLAKGTMTMPAVEAAIGKADDVAPCGGLLAAYALATTLGAAPIASPALTVSTTSLRRLRGAA